MWDIFVKRGLAAAFYLYALAAQVSGSTSTLLAVVLTVAGTVAIFFPTHHHAKAWYMSRPNRARPQVELPFPIIIALVAAWLVFTGAVGTVLWRHWSPSSGAGSNGHESLATPVAAPSAPISAVPRAKFNTQTVRDVPPLLAELHRLLDTVVPPAVDAASTAFYGYSNGPSFQNNWPKNPKALSERLAKAQNLIQESTKGVEHFLTVNNLYRELLSKTVEDENGSTQKLLAIILRHIRINDSLVPLAQTNEGLDAATAALLAAQDDYMEAVRRYQGWLDKSRYRIKEQIAEF
jgi:hypothetical protein